MDQKALFDLLFQQGFRLLDTSDAMERSLFEWRVETVVIPHPSSEEYSPLELLMIDQLIAKQTDHEISVAAMIQTAGGDFAGSGASDRDTP